MTNDKFDSAFKAKADEIKIQASADAWRRLNSLTEQSTAKKKYLWIYYAAAACCVGLLCTFFIGNLSSDEQNLDASFSSFTIEELQIDEQNDYDKAMLQWAAVSKSHFNG